MEAAASLLRRVSSHLARVPRPLLPSSSLESPFCVAPSAAPSLPRFAFGASVELMAVPKKKVSRHKRGLRNGPKALKPIPVIVRCKHGFLVVHEGTLACGRVKLPHFYCCSGERGASSSSS